MQNRLRRDGRPGLSHPFQSVTKSISTSQGRYTFYAIIVCAILGMLLSKPMILLVQRLNPTLPPQNATNLATLITVGGCAVLLIVSLLKMYTIMAALENRRLKAFNQRMEQRKGSNNSDG